MHALRHGHRHLHRGGCTRTTRQRRGSEASAAFQSSRPTSSAYSSLLAVTSPMEGPPMPWPAMSCSLKMRSNPSVKHCGLKMSPWMTPRLTGNGSEHIVSPLGKRRRSIPVASVYMAFTMRRILGCTPAAAKDSSRKWWYILLDTTKNEVTPCRLKSRKPYNNGGSGDAKCHP